MRRKVLVVAVHEPEFGLRLGQGSADPVEIDLPVLVRPDAEVPEMQDDPLALPREQARDAPDDADRPFLVAVPVPGDDDPPRAAGRRGASPGSTPSDWSSPASALGACPRPDSAVMTDL